MRTSIPISMRCLREVFAQMMLGKKVTPELPDMAANALADGIDSPSLRILAGLDTEQAIAGEREIFFRKAGAELGIIFPDSKEAAMYSN